MWKMLCLSKYEEYMYTNVWQEVHMEDFACAQSTCTLAQNRAHEGLPLIYFQ